ncbi:MAG: flagellar biosynthetic protein FliR [Phycisphaerales bacterium]
MNPGVDAMQFLSEKAVPFLLVAFRLAGVFITTPMLASASLPAKHKVLLTFMLAAATFPSLPAPQRVVGGEDLFAVIPLVVSEAAVGFVLGTFVAIPLLALEASGAMCGHQMGISMGRVYNPAADEDADVIGQLLYFGGLAVFFASGGLDRTVGALMASFGNVPIGAFVLREAPGEAVVGLVSSGVELALRVSSPVTAIVLLLSITFGAVGKTMPQVNIMSVGFAAKAVAGLFMLFFSAYASSSASSENIHHSVDAAVGWLLAPRS